MEQELYLFIYTYVSLLKYTYVKTFYFTVLILVNIWISPVFCNICLHLCPLGPGTGEAELCFLNTWLQNTLRNSEAIQSHRRAVFIMCTVLYVCMYGCVYVYVGRHAYMHTCMKTRIQRVVS